MISRRALSALMFAVVVAAAIVGPIRSDVHKARAAGESLPWPACSPDATPPPAQSSWEDEPPQDPSQNVVTDYESNFQPLVDLLVEPAAIVPLAPSGLSGEQQVEIEVETIVWKSAFREPPASLVPQVLSTPERVTATGLATTWTEAVAALAEGKRLVVGLEVLRGSETVPYALAYVVDPAADQPTFLGQDPLYRRYSQQFADFLKWDGNPRPDALPTELLRVWNVQADAPLDLFPAPSPLMNAFERFYDDATGLDDVASSLDAWSALPAKCRSLRDAPRLALRDLLPGLVWLHVPESWRGLSDAAICLRNSMGSMGCVIPSTLDPSFPYMYWDEAAGVPGEPPILQVAKLKDGAVSWVERFPVLQIEPSLFSNSPVLASLNPQVPAYSYDQLRNLEGTVLGTYEALSTSEHEELVQSIPRALEHKD